MKSFFRAIADSNCQNRRLRRKQRNTKDSSDLNRTMGASLDLQRAAPIKILLVPCESQPPSSTRYWIIHTRRGKIPVFGSSGCKIVQHMGNRVTEPFQGHILRREGRTIIKGILTDGAIEGKYFELVLSTSLQDLNEKLKTSDSNAAFCGILQRSSREKSGIFEETHDAFLHTVPENGEISTAKAGEKQGV